MPDVDKAIILLIAIAFVAGVALCALIGWIFSLIF